MSSELTIARALACGEAQATLFATRPSRLALSGLALPVDPSAARRRIRVWRNHAFEPLIDLIAPYATFGRWWPEFDLGDYDDSLMFDPVPAADLHLLWLDNARLLDKLSPGEWLDWITARLQALRQQTTSPVLIASWLAPDLAPGFAERIAALPGVHWADLRAPCAEDGCTLLDARNTAWAGSPLSRQAQVAVARVLGCRWLPALLAPPVKAIALDLDHTLYRGVLGEDGAAGIELTAAHEALQRQLLAWREQGVFLAMVSRNEPTDVEAMFRARPDFPLGWQHFSAREISWGDKSDALARIAAALRIGIDAILYVDDNPGELAEVTLRHPPIRTAWAAPDATQTVATLAHYPALWRWTRSREDGQRIQDLQAHAARESLAAQSTDLGAYFKSLQVALSYRVNAVADLPRLANLCVKTNQFNLALARLSVTQLQRHLDDPSASLCSVGLSDRLSDSGTIAVVVARREGDQLEVLEICISCRAMGRQLEDSIVCIALGQMALLAGCRTVCFKVEHGPRNQPARSWLARWLGHAPEAGWHEVDAERIRRFTPPSGVGLQFQ